MIAGHTPEDFMSDPIRRLATTLTSQAFLEANFAPAWLVTRWATRGQAIGHCYSQLANKPHAGRIEMSPHISLHPHRPVIRVFQGFAERFLERVSRNDAFEKRGLNAFAIGSQDQTVGRKLSCLSQLLQPCQ